MTNKYILWDKVSAVYTPGGTSYTAEEWINKYNWIKAPGAIPVMLAGVINGGFIGELNSMKRRCEQQGATFDPSLSGQALLDAIEAWEDERAEAAKQAAEEAANTPSAEERLAAAVEFQNLMNL